MRTGYSLRSVFLLGIAGAAIGAMIVPEIEPGSVRIPALWQMACGLLGGTLMAVAFGAGTLGILTSALAGIVLGFLAPYWMKYVNF
jgi:hypothetical protein